MNHNVDTGPLTKSEGGLNLLHEVDDDWLESTATAATTQLQLQPFNGLFSRTTWVSRYQKGKTNLDFTEARERVAVASAGPYASLHLAPDR